MNIYDILNVLDAKLVSGDDKMAVNFEYAFASDLMSDVLTTQMENMVLLTGLANVQAIRTAEMSDIQCVILVRNKKATPEMISIASECGIAIIEFSGSMFKASGLLFQNGLKPIF